MNETNDFPTKLKPAGYIFSAPGITKIDVAPHGGAWKALFTADQMRAYVLADRAARAGGAVDWIAIADKLRADALTVFHRSGAASDVIEWYTGSLWALAAPTQPQPEAAEPVQRQPDGYAYEYPGPFGGIAFTSGGERNGAKPTRAIPYYFGTTPAPKPVQADRAALVSRIMTEVRNCAYMAEIDNGDACEDSKWRIERMLVSLAAPVTSQASEPSAGNVTDAQLDAAFSASITDPVWMRFTDKQRRDIMRAALAATPQAPAPKVVQPLNDDTARLDWLLPNLHAANFGLQFDGGYECADDAELLHKWRAAIDAARAQEVKP